MDIVEGRIVFDPPIETIFPTLELLIDDIMGVIAHIPCIQKSIFSQNKSNAKLKFVSSSICFSFLVLRFFKTRIRNVNSPELEMAIFLYNTFSVDISVTNDV